MEQISDINKDTERKCVKCGTALDSNQKYCPNCGADNMMMSQRICPNCSSVIGAKMTFCPNCGAPDDGNKLSKKAKRKKNKKRFYKRPIFWIIVVLISIVICLPDGTDPGTVNKRIVNEENVVEIVNEILELTSGDIDEMKSLYEQGKQYMTEEQKEQCLNQYRKWTVYNYAVNDLRGKMKNPKSFQVESGSVGKPFEYDGKLTVKVTITYYATNSFGGELRDSSWATVKFDASGDEMSDIYIDDSIYWF